MHPVSVIDLLTLISLVWAAIALAVSMHGLKSQDPVKLLTIGFLCFGILYHMLLYLEWSSSNSIFNRLEDFAGALIPMWWVFLFYGILQIISNRNLASAKHRYQIVVDNINELIIKLNDDNRIRFASPSFCALIEKSEEELIGRDFLSAMEMDAGSPVFGFLDQAKRPPFTVDYETPMETRQGVRWFAWNAKGLLEDAENESSILIVGYDISKRKKAEQSLQESETRHRQFIENQPVGMFRAIIEGDGRFVMANPAMARMAGYPTVESFMKNSVINLYRDPEQRQLVLKRLRMEGEIHGLEVEGIRRDGVSVISSVSLQLARDDQGNPAFADGTIVDITERRMAEEALRKSQELHCQAQRIAKLGHWELMIGDDYPICSDEMYRIFEFEKTSSGISFDAALERVHPEDRIRLDDQINRAIGKRAGIDIVHRVLLPDERVKYVHCLGHVECDNNGNPVKIVGTLQNVTKLKEAEIEREQSEKKLLQAQKLEAIGTLAGGIAHDFNNILTSILGFTQISIAELPEDVKTREYLEQVLQAGLRARDLVSHILAFSRKGEQSSERIQVHVIIKEVAKLLRASIPANIEINQKISSRCCPVLADTIQVHQIIMNLCTNSYHAIGSRKGTISISLEETEIGPQDFPEMSNMIGGKHVKLVVSDTGCGMAQSTLERIFDPYFTTKKKEEGTGLGLAVVHGIVKKLGGHITAYSEPGQGTSFCVYLPCAKEQQTINQEVGKKEISGGNEHILLVDDEKAITEMLTGLLSHLGYMVTAFTDADEAIEFYRSQPDSFDLIVTDMTMPAMNGEALSHLIREIDPQIPIIIQTGFSKDLDINRLQSIGVGAVLKKPVLERELAQCIRNVIDKKERITD